MSFYVSLLDTIKNIRKVNRGLYFIPVDVEGPINLSDICDYLYNGLKDFEFLEGCSVNYSYKIINIEFADYIYRCKFISNNRSFCVYAVKNDD